MPPAPGCERCRCRCPARGGHGRGWRSRSVPSPALQPGLCVWTSPRQLFSSSCLTKGTLMAPGKEQDRALRPSRERRGSGTPRGGHPGAGTASAPLAPPSLPSPNSSSPTFAVKLSAARLGAGKSDFSRWVPLFPPPPPLLSSPPVLLPLLPAGTRREKRRRAGLELLSQSSANG